MNLTEFLIAEKKIAEIEKMSGSVMDAGPVEVVKFRIEIMKLRLLSELAYSVTMLAKATTLQSHG